MEVSIHSLFARTLERSAHPDSLVGTIAETLGRAIIEGELYPGDDLNSVDLSRQFHTSRTPVREALLLLEKEGLVVISPRRRPYVARMDLTEVREIYQVRAHLHMLVSELVSPRCPTRLLRNSAPRWSAWRRPRRRVIEIAISGVASRSARQSWRSVVLLVAADAG